MKIKLGQVIETLSLESIQGSSVIIPHSTQITHLQFRRFAGCPMCNLHLQSFVKRHREIIANGIQEVAIFHSSKNDMLKLHAEAPFPLIADPLKKLYKSFGVESSISSILKPKAIQAALKGVFKTQFKLPALGESPLGLPADFLINSSGKVIAVKYGTHAYDHWEVDEILRLSKSNSK